MNKTTKGKWRRRKMAKRITIQVELTPDVLGNYYWKVLDLNESNNPFNLSLDSGYGRTHESATQQALSASKRFL